jgi:hypothetical protein
LCYNEANSESLREEPIKKGGFIVGDKAKNIPMPVAIVAVVIAFVLMFFAYKKTMTPRLAQETGKPPEQMRQGAGPGIMPQGSGAMRRGPGGMGGMPRGGGMSR